ncbi:hypothetical protein BD289DRAFT_432076, partial [Coniella lustricola]
MLEGKRQQLFALDICMCASILWACICGSFVWGKKHVELLPVFVFYIDPMLIPSKSAMIPKLPLFKSFKVAILI